MQFSVQNGQLHVILFTPYSSKRFQSLTGQESISLSAANGTATSAGNDLDTLKQEILAEVRKEIQKAKVEIIEGESGKYNFAVP